MESRDIQVLGAREHNLKDLHLSIPRERFVVITGPSGSGKSSLAKDTLYAEGHRRYMECLSTEARQLLRQVQKPAVDRIEGLPPSIYIEQRSAVRNPRSTVGTTTELYDLFRLLYAKVGIPHCVRCGAPIQAQSLEQMTDRVLELPEGTRLIVLAPLLTGRTGGKRLLEGLEREGFLRIRLDGKIRELGDPGLKLTGRADAVEVVVDRLTVRPGIRARLNDSIETAARLSDGIVRAWIDPGGPEAQEWNFSERALCGACGASFPELAPHLFSFNSPHGACPACSGLGRLHRVDVHRVVPNPRLSLSEGAIAPWRNRPGHHVGALLQGLSRHAGFDLYTPFEELPEEARRLLLYGSGGKKIPLRFPDSADGEPLLRPFEGVIPNMERRYRETGSEKVRQEIGAYMTEQTCPACKGTRLRPEALSVLVDGKNIAEIAAMDIHRAGRFFSSLRLPPLQAALVAQVLEEIRRRLDFLAHLGLGHLTLDRRAATLSGGESQRIQLATHIGSGLVGVLYILYEPTLGLHARDTERLLELLRRLRDRGNTVLVVEHDEQVILAADHVIDMGPGAGTAGGRVVYSGPAAGLMEAPESITGSYLSGRRRIPIPPREAPDRGLLVLSGVRHHNLKNVTVRIPVGLLTCVTGVSGSGKSSLVLDVLYPLLADRLRGVGPVSSTARFGPVRAPRLKGIEFFDRVLPVDQNPLGRSPRSNPATYTGLFSLLRDLFAQLPESRRRGYGPARFSFNVKGGRCEVCRGEGLRRVEMHFLPDVYVTCDLCRGRRYNRETLEVRYRGKNIAEVLEMTVTEALAFFEPVPQVRRRLEILEEVGLGYLQLGQPATTLSGGEAQRVKLARELSKAETGRTLYLMDEPTTGLHFTDIERLLQVLRRLTERGDTVLVIEHNLEVIKTADWVIDLGPEAGDAGGRLIAEGPPEAIAGHPDSHTGRFLRRLLDREADRRA